MECFYLTSGNENESPFVQFEGDTITINQVPFKADFLLSLVTDDDWHSADHCWSKDCNIVVFSIDSDYRHKLPGEKQLKVIYDDLNCPPVSFRIHRDSLVSIFDIYMNDYLK